MNNFLQPACLNRITVSQLEFPCNAMTSSDVDGIVVQASRNKIKARTTESVNEQINIYAFPLANRYLICNFIIHGVARDCSQQGRCASSFRFALFSASVSASLLFPRTTKQADNLFFVLCAIDIAGAFQAWRIKGP